MMRRPRDGRDMKLARRATCQILEGFSESEVEVIPDEHPEQLCEAFRSQRRR